LIFSITYPLQKDAQENTINLFWDNIEKFVVNNMVSRQLSKSKSPIFKFACSQLTTPTNGETLVCYQHQDCIKKEFFNRLVKERNLDEEEKKITSQNIDQLVGNVEVGLILLNLEDGSIIGYNTKAKDLLSFDEKDITKLKNWIELAPCGFLPTNWDTFSKIAIKVEQNSKSFILGYQFYKNSKSKVIQVDSSIGTFLDMKYSILVFTETLFGA